MPITFWSVVCPSLKLHPFAAYKLTTSCNQLDLSTVVRMQWQLSPGRWSNRLSQRGQSSIRLNPREAGRGFQRTHWSNPSTVWHCSGTVQCVAFNIHVFYLTVAKWLNEYSGSDKTAVLPHKKVQPTKPNKQPVLSTSHSFRSSRSQKMYCNTMPHIFRISYGPTVLALHPILQVNLVMILISFSSSFSSEQAEKKIFLHLGGEKQKLIKANSILCGSPARLETRKRLGFTV